MNTTNTQKLKETVQLLKSKGVDMDTLINSLLTPTEQEVKAMDFDILLDHFYEIINKESKLGRRQRDLVKVRVDRLIKNDYFRIVDGEIIINKYKLSTEWWNELPLQNIEDCKYGRANLCMLYFPGVTDCQELNEDEILHIYEQEMSLLESNQ